MVESFSRRVQWISSGISSGAELLDLDIEFWSSVTVKGWLKLSVLSEVNFMLFFFLFDSDWVKLIWVIFFCRWHLSKGFCHQVGYMLFICGFCVSFREVIYCVAAVFFLNFITSQFLGICIRICIRNERSQGGSFSFFEDTSGFCPLLFVFVQIFWWVVCFEFSESAWRFLLLLHSSVNHGLLWFGLLGFMAYQPLLVI